MLIKTATIGMINRILYEPHLLEEDQLEDYITIDDIPVDNIPDLEFYQKLELVQSSRTPIEVLERLADDTDDDIRSYLSSRHDVSENILRKLSNDFCIEVLLGVYNNPNTSSNILKNICEIHLWNEKACYYSIDDPNTLINLFDNENDHNFFIWSIAGNKNTLDTILKKLSFHGCNHIRRYIASNPNTPLESLYYLSNDEDDDVRSELLMNPNIPDKIFDKLSVDRYCGISAMLADYSLFSFYRLRLLSDHKSVYVRKNLSKIQSIISWNLLEKLENDKDFRFFWDMGSQKNITEEEADRNMIREKTLLGKKRKAEKASAWKISK